MRSRMALLTRTWGSSPRRHSALAVAEDTPRQPASTAEMNVSLEGIAFKTIAPRGFCFSGSPLPSMHS